MIQLAATGDEVLGEAYQLHPSQAATSPLPASLFFLWNRVLLGPVMG